MFSVPEPLKFFFSFIYFWETETEHKWGEGQREKETESKAGSRLWAVSTEPNVGLELTNHEIMTWAEVGRLTDWATQAPQCLFIFERESESKQGRGRERGRHRIWSRLQAPSCQHRAWCGAQTHKLWDHDLSWSRTLNQLSHPGAPPFLLIDLVLYLFCWYFSKSLHFDLFILYPFFVFSISLPSAYIFIFFDLSHF